MPWLEQRGNSYRIKFRFAEKNYSVPLKAEDEREAGGLLARFEENLRLLSRGRLELPDGANLGLFLLSDGKLAKKPEPKVVMTVGELFDLYLSTLTPGAKEANTLKSEGIHLRHLRRLLKAATPITQIGTHSVQSYVDRRAGEKYRRSLVRAVTIKKETSTLQTVWNWASRRGYIAAAAPVKGITYPKEREKPPFRTYEQIQAIVDRGGLTKYEVRELWDGVFLDKDQVAEVLTYVKGNAPSDWIHPFFVAAAHSGARRSELMRAQVEDFDFANRVVLLREKKMSRLRDTFRTVEMTPLVESVMTAYFANWHPGGRFAFCSGRNEPISDSVSRKAFRGVLRNSKWKVLRGYHVFRHSFASNLAVAGIDEHVIGALMGHLTAEMRNRYRHLFPSTRRAAIASVYG